jgi:hypothetical protein
LAVRVYARQFIRRIEEESFAWAGESSLGIHDIGAPIDDRQLSAALLDNGVIQHGRLGDEAIRQLMQDALYGLLAYPVEFVAKSGVFAAYCSHGLCPVLISDNYVQADGLIAGQHYLSSMPNAGTVCGAITMGQSVFGWYQ